MRCWLTQIISLVAVLIVLVPAVSLAIAIFSLAAFAYVTALISLTLGISIRVLGVRLLAYLERRKEKDLLD